MALSIKDPETDALARELASATGEGLTEAVKTAIRERLERTRGSRRRKGLAGRLMRIGRRCAAEVAKPSHSLDHGDLLYDERGLPR